VGLNTQIDVEWSKPRVFVVDAAAVPKNEKVVERVKLVNEELNCRDVHWLGFEGGGVYARQSGSGSSYAPYLDWMPYCRLTTAFDLIPSLGGSVFKRSGGGRYAVVSLLAELGFRPLRDTPLTAALGVGAQYWTGFSGVHAQVSARLLWRFPALLSHVSLGYSYMIAGTSVHFVGLGAGLDFSPSKAEATK
jgi:hypothetical protein